MVANLNGVPHTTATPTPPILNRSAFRTCHIRVPDMERPMGAIAYSNHFYSYVRFYPTLEAARRGASRLLQRGNRVVLTQVPKGFVLWVLELDAELSR